MWIKLSSAYAQHLWTQGSQNERWTYRLILELTTWLNRKHGEVGFYLAQALSGHGCFNAYLSALILSGTDATMGAPYFFSVFSLQLQ